MAKFFENNLRPEEMLAGYNVGEPDDDIFQIKDKDYPDDIQDYIYHEPEIQLEEVSNPINEINEIDIDDILIDKPIIDADKNEEKPSIEIKNEQNLDDNIWNTFEDNEESNADDLLSTATTNPAEIIEELENELPMESIKEEPDILESKKEFSFELDDDFKKQLAEQLEAKKAKQNEATFAEPEQINEANAEEFVPIEETDNAQFYDLAEFGNERPSEKSSSKDTENKDNNTEVSDENKKKEKSKLPWILTVAAASIILLAGLAYLIMYYLIPNFYQKEEIVKKDSTHKVEENITKKTETKHDKKEDHSVEKPVEDKEVTKEVDKEVKKETEEEIIARINKEFASKQQKKTEEVIKKEEIVTEKPKEEIKIEKNKELVAKKEEKKIEKPRVDKPVIKEKPVITKETKIQPKKEEKKIDIVKDTKPITEVKKEENIKEAVYTIQVYSSPSKEDAVDWIQKLKSKNINASLSEQMIRDVKWYRVRFGSFSTREEAKAVALRNGFSQTWIDRVK